MTTKHPVGLPDLLRACERLGVTSMAQCAGIAPALGLEIVPPAESGQAGDTEHPMPVLQEREDEPSPDAEMAQPDGGEFDFSITSAPRPERTQREPSPYVAAATPLPPDPLPVSTSQALQSLFAPRLSRYLLRQSLSRSVADAAPDIERLVVHLSTGEPLTEIPQLCRSSLRYGVQVLCDISEAMLPFARDQDTLLHQIEQLVGTSLVQVTYFEGFPHATETADDDDETQPYTPPAPGTPVLLVSDLGIGRPPHAARAGTTRDWLEFARCLREIGCPVIAFIPYRPTRWSPLLRSVIEMHHWDRPRYPAVAPVVDVAAWPEEAEVCAMLRRQARRNSAVVELARVLSVAAHIEPRLVRAARLALLPDVDAGTEAELLFSELVEAHSTQAIVLLPAVVQRLRRELCAERALLDRTRAFLQAYRAQQQAPQTTLLEEQINFLACEDDTSGAALEQLLAPAVKSLIDPRADNAGLAYWALQSAPRLPRPLRDSRTARELQIAARLRVARRAVRLDELPDDVASVDWLLPEALPTTPIGLRWTDKGLRVAEPAPAGWHRIDIPDTQPRTLQVEDVQGNSERYTLERNTFLDIPVPRAPVVISTIDGASHRLEPIPAIEHRVLWVDDEPQNNVQAVRELRGHGIDVMVRDSTHGGLGAIRRMPFDAVITDLLRYEAGTRHERAGYDLFTALRNAGVAVPVILSTAQPNEEEALDLGFYATANTQEGVVEQVLRALQDIPAGAVSDWIKAACVTIETLGSQGEPAIAFAVSEDLLVTSAERFRNIPFLTAGIGEGVQVNVLNKPDDGTEVLVLRPLLEADRFSRPLVLMDEEEFRSGLKPAKQTRTMITLPVIAIGMEAGVHQAFPAKLYLSNPHDPVFLVELQQAVSPQTLLGAPLFIEDRVVGMINADAEGAAELPMFEQFSVAMAKNEGLTQEVRFTAISAWRIKQTLGQVQTVTADSQLPEILEQHLRWVKSRHEEGRRADLSGWNLENAALHRVELTGALLDKANLRGADLSGATLGLASLHGADLEGAKLTGAELRGAELDAANFKDAALNDADASEARFRGATLAGARLTNANFGDALLMEADLSRVDLRHAGLRGADLRTGDLRGARVQGADFSHADLSFARLDGLDFRRAKLDGALLNGVELDTVHLTKQQLRNLEQPTHLIETLEGSGSLITAVSIAPDGKTAVSGLHDNTLEVWDLRAGVVRLALKGHSSDVRTVAILPDGGTAVSGSSDGSIKVWDLRTGEVRQTLEGHRSAANAVAIAPDGKTAVSGSSDKTLEVWDLSTGEARQTLAGHDDSVSAVAIAPDGRTVVSGSNDKTLKVWDLHSGEIRQTLEGHTQAVNAVAIAPNGKIAVSGSVDKTLRVWDLHTGELRQTLEGHGDMVSAVAITPDGRTVVSGASDNTLRVWDLHTGELRRVLEGHGAPVSAVAIAPDGRTAVSASLDGILKIWDLRAYEGLQSH